MADYRDMAAALSGGYGQDTGPITADTLITLKNGKKTTASDLLGMLKGFGQSVSSNLESLGRGGVASVIGAGGDLETFGRMGLNKLYGAGGVNVSETPVLPTTTDILGMMPRATVPRRETAGMEELGGYMTPATAKVLKPLATGYLNLARQEIANVSSGMPSRSLLGDITPKPLMAVEPTYRGSHTAPNAKIYGATLDDLTQIMPENVYTSQGKNLYGVRDSVIDHQWWMAAKKARGNPDAEVEVFRAVPKGVKDINSGDWVSTSRKYAEDHGESALSGEYEIISKKVKAKTLSTAGDPQEYGYNPNFEYPQQAALDLAQQRAALPKSESGLGLPANNTPEMRYQAMKGVEGNFVHGSKNPDIEKFKTRKQIFEESANDPNRAIAENHYANERNAVFASSDPEFTTAFSQHGYTDVGQAPTSYPLRMIGGNKVFDFENPAHLDMLKQKYAEMFPVKTIGREGYVPSEESIRMHTINKRIENLPNDTNNWPAIESQDFQKAIRELGFDAFHVNERGTKNIGVYDPSSLRSPFAAYDPFRKDVATATAMGVALPDLLAAEKENKQKKLSKALTK